MFLQQKMNTTTPVERNTTTEKYLSCVNSLKTLLKTSKKGKKTLPRMTVGHGT